MSKLVAGGDLGSSVNLPTTTTSPTHHQYHHHHQLALVHRGEATTSASADSSLGRPPSRRTDIASLAHSLTNIAQQLSRRIAFRKAMKQGIQRTMKAGAKGVKIAVAGRLGGSEMARREWDREGRIPLGTLTAMFMNTEWSVL